MAAEAASVISFLAQIGSILLSNEYVTLPYHTGTHNLAV